MKTDRGIFRAATLLVVMLCWPAVARGQQVSPGLFDPAATPLGILSLHSARPLPHLSVYAGLLGHYTNDALVEGRGDGVFSRPVHHRAVADLALALGLWDRLELSLALPVVLRQTGAHYPDGLTDSADSGLGDLRMGLKVHALRVAGVGLAGAVEVTAPTAAKEALMGEGSWTVTPRLVLDWVHRSGLVLAFNAGYRVREAASVGSLTVDDEVRLGLGAEVPLGVAGLSVAAEVLAGIGLGDDPADPTFPAQSEYPVEALGAFRWRHHSGLMLTAGMGAGLTSGYGAPDYRVLLGLGFLAGTAGQRAAAQRQVAAPASQPSAPAPASAPPTAPPAAAPANVTVALTPQLFDRAASADPDPDGDGIPAPLDRCPAKPEDNDGFQDADGCPDHDNDQDGVPDATDRCPLKAEVINGVDDDDGCPDQGKAKVVLTAAKVEISERVYFKTGSDALKQRSHELLRQVAAVLKANYQVRRVRVEGHTDNRGDKEMNVDLSERRARSVMRFLIEQGVAAHRLEGKGYGPSRPVVSNRRRAGRAKNRRVEFVVLKIAAVAPGKGGTP